MAISQYGKPAHNSCLYNNTCQWKGVLVWNKEAYKALQDVAGSCQGLHTIRGMKSSVKVVVVSLKDLQPPLFNEHME